MKKERSVSVPKQPTVVYIGASIKNVVQTNTIFSNGLPAVLNKMCQEKPFLKDLIIPLSGLAEARKELGKKGSALQVLYQKTLKL